MDGPGVHAVYGIELADGRVTVVRGARRKGRVVTEVLAENEPAGSDNLARVAQEVSGECRTGRALSACTCPAQDSFIRLVDTPIASVSKARAVFPSMLDVQLPFPLEQCVYRFAHTHRTAEGRTRAVATAVPGDRIGELIATWQEQGFDPEWIEQEAMAVWRYSSRAESVNPSPPRVVIFAGTDRSVAVIGRDGVPVASFGTRQPLSASAGEGDKFTRRLRQQVAGTLGVGGSDDPVYFVCGPGATNAESIRNELGVDPTHWIVGDASSVCLARILAENTLLSDTWSANLRGGEFEHAHIQTLGRRARSRAAVAILIASAALAAISFVSSALVKAKHDRLRASLQDEARALTGLAVVPPGQEVFIAGQYVDADAENYRIFNEWVARTRYPDLKQILETARKRGMTLETVALRPGAALVRGTSEDWRHAESLAEPFSSRGWDTKVERSDAGDDERVHFTVKAQR